MSDARPSYEPEALRALFDEMAQTYGAMNLVSSFGFAARWRHQIVAALPPTEPLRRVVDLMSGMGELWRSLSRRLGPDSQVIAVDLSSEMTRRAPKRTPFPVSVRTADVFEHDFGGDRYDAVVSSFGLKTLSPEQQEKLALRVADLLRPGGTFAFVEISVPPSALLRQPYMFYVKTVIPRIGRVFLGNPANYRQLGVYTEAFGNCVHFAACLRRVGLEAVLTSYFFGCATGVVGRKPW
ncbi:MAG TPA: class I SAM-dependent methyltransferase [Myxococcota bacterium]|nr:class I SAM-dependent methyltransferase [Myxococcota bacterium]